MINLHIMNDEKIISRAISSFNEALPNSNRFVILCKKENCRYVKLHLDNVFYVEYNSSAFWQVIGDIKNYKYIIIHYLSFSASNFINKIDHDKIVWIIWGADLYLNLLSRKGYKLYDNSLRAHFWNYTISPIRSIKDTIKRICYYNSLKKSIYKISYVTGLDSSLLKFYYPGLKFREKQFFYYPIDEIVGNFFNSNLGLGDNIILGNSASFTNNHTSVFKVLSTLSVTNRKILTPLSYGEGKEYVMKVGHKYCPKSFIPIVDFRPIAEYNKLLFSARTFIYAHFRQEAIGNILTALYIGGCVFLYKINPLYNFFKKQGFFIFCIEDLSRMVDYKLSEEEKDNNRRLCVELYGKKQLMCIIQKEFS